MPTRTPQKPRIRPRAADSFATIDWLALWALSLGICAMVLAAIAYFSIGDAMGASFILASAAGIIGVALHASKPPAQH